MGTFSLHQAACLALGGDLVTYLSAEVQHQVERYFLKQTPLYSYWWVAAGGDAWWQRPQRTPFAVTCGQLGSCDACRLPWRSVLV
jgi:hypothetical protein